jgi:hypothetical protein
VPRQGIRLSLSLNQDQGIRRDDFGQAEENTSRSESLRAVWAHHVVLFLSVLVLFSVDDIETFTILVFVDVVQAFGFRISHEIISQKIKLRAPFRLSAGMVETIPAFGRRSCQWIKLGDDGSSGRIYLRREKSQLSRNNTQRVFTGTYCGTSCEGVKDVKDLISG